MLNYKSELNQTIIKPWGNYTVIKEESNFKIKHIVVDAQQKLSLQLHYKRSELWVIIEGEALVTNGNETFSLKANETTYIPNEAIHRIENNTNKTMSFIEIQYGSYLGEDDIVRFEDMYNRPVLNR